MIRWQGVTIDRSKRTIAHDGDAIHLSGLRFQLACALLLGGPMCREALFDLLYDDDDEGGPLSGLNIIDVLFCQIKPKLASLGLKLCADGERYWWHKRYWAEPINQKEGDAHWRPQNEISPNSNRTSTSAL